MATRWLAYPLQYPSRTCSRPSTHPRSHPLYLPVFPVQYYVMAAKDILCGNQNAGNAGLLPDATTYIKPSKTEMEDYCTSSDCTSSDLEKIAKMCKDQKWVGAPDPTDDLKDNWGRDPCKEPPAFGMFVMPFIWYFVFYLGLLSYLIFNIWSLKEELAGAPKNDTEMGAAKPAVAVATATATATAA